MPQKWKIGSKADSMNLPKGPDTPWFVQYYAWLYKPLEFLDECSARYGDIFTIQIAKGGRHRPMIMISDPALVQQLLTADFKNFESGEGHHSMKDYVGENSLLVSDGALHRKHRTVIKPQFYGEHLKVYGERMGEICNQEMSAFRHGGSFSVREFMQELSMKIIVDTVVGARESEETQELQRCFPRFMNWLTSLSGHIFTNAPAAQISLGPLSPWGYYLKETKAIDQLLYKLMAQAKQAKEGERYDVLTMLVNTRDQEGETLSDKEIRDEILTLLISGHETVAAAMSWAMYYIHENPEVKAKLIAEIESLGENTDPMSIFKLPYLTAVCDETLRLRPSLIVAFTRMPKERFSLGNFEFEPRTNLMPCIYLTHQRPSIFKSPREFQPERFLGQQYSPYEYYPFGGSNRRCIGAAYAMYEMKIVLANILRNWKIARKDLITVKARRRGITITPPDAFKLEVFGRR